MLHFQLENYIIKAKRDTHEYGSWTSPSVYEDKNMRVTGDRLLEWSDLYDEKMGLGTALLLVQHARDSKMRVCML